MEYKWQKTDYSQIIDYTHSFCYNYTNFNKNVFLKILSSWIFAVNLPVTSEGFFIVNICPSVIKHNVLRSSNYHKNQLSVNDNRSDFKQKDKTSRLTLGGIVHVVRLADCVRLVCRGQWRGRSGGTYVTWLIITNFFYFRITLVATTFISLLFTIKNLTTIISLVV